MLSIDIRTLAASALSQQQRKDYKEGCFHDAEQPRERQIGVSLCITRRQTAECCALYRQQRQCKTHRNIEHYDLERCIFYFKTTFKMCAILYRFENSNYILQFSKYNCLYMKSIGSGSREAPISSTELFKPFHPQP